MGQGGLRNVWGLQGNLPEIIDTNCANADGFGLFGIALQIPKGRPADYSGILKVGLRDYCGFVCKSRMVGPGIIKDFHACP